MVLGHFDPVLGDLAPLLCGAGYMDFLPYGDQQLLSIMYLCPSTRVWNEQWLPAILIGSICIIIYAVLGYRYKKEILDYKPYATYTRLLNLSVSQKLKENTVYFKESYCGLCANLQVFTMACCCPYMRLLDTFTSFDLIEDEDFKFHCACLHIFPTCYLCCYAPYLRTKMRQKLGSSKECTCTDCLLICCFCNFGIAQLARVADKSTGVGTKYNCSMFEMSTGQPIAKPVRIKEKRKSSIVEEIDVDDNN